MDRGGRDRPRRAAARDHRVPVRPLHLPPGGLAVDALAKDEHLDELRGYAEDSGEGRWTVEAAVDHAVPLPAITASLYARFASRQSDAPAMKMISALRNEFGGHAVTDAGGRVAKEHHTPGA